MPIISKSRTPLEPALKIAVRSAQLVNPKLATGEIEIVCKELDILNASVTPPFQLDEENVEADWVLALQQAIYTQKVYDLIVASGFAPTFTPSDVPAAQ